MAKKDHQPRVAQIGQNNSRYLEWQREMAHHDEQRRAATAETESALVECITQATGLDVVKIARDIRQHADAKLEPLRKEEARLRKQGRDIVTRESREFQVALRRHLKCGMAKLLEKTHHNPSLRMKLARRWEHDAKPSVPGMGGGGVGFHSVTSWSHHHEFDVIEDPALGDVVNTIHPACSAQVGSTDRYGEADSWVTQTLIYEHAPPADYSLLVDRVWVPHSVFGYAQSNASGGVYLFGSIALTGGGVATLGLSVRVEQPVRTGGREELLVHEVVTNELVAETHSCRAISLGPPWLSPDAPRWGPVRVLPGDAFRDRPIPVFGAPSGGPVTVHVEFKCAAAARLEGAAAEMEFHRDGMHITVHEVTLQGDVTIRSGP